MEIILSFFVGVFAAVIMLMAKKIRTITMSVNAIQKNVLDIIGINSKIDQLQEQVNDLKEQLDTYRKDYSENTNQQQSSQLELRNDAHNESSDVINDEKTTETFANYTDDPIWQDFEKAVHQLYLKDNISKLDDKNFLVNTLMQIKNLGRAVFKKYPEEFKNHYWDIPSFNTIKTVLAATYESEIRQSDNYKEIEPLFIEAIKKFPKEMKNFVETIHKSAMSIMSFANLNKSFTEALDESRNFVQDACAKLMASDYSFFQNLFKKVTPDDMSTFIMKYNNHEYDKYEPVNFGIDKCESDKYEIGDFDQGLLSEFRKFITSNDILSSWPAMTDFVIDLTGINIDGEAIKIYTTADPSSYTYMVNNVSYSSEGDLVERSEDYFSETVIPIFEEFFKKKYNKNFKEITINQLLK